MCQRRTVCADAVSFTLSYIPVVYCLNKIDAISIEELDLLYRIPNAVPISSEHGWNIDELMEAMWDKLSLKRVYTKPKGKQPDYTAPVVLRKNKCTVEDFVSGDESATADAKLIRERFANAAILLVQCHPQDDYGAVQDCYCLWQVCQAPTAKGRLEPRAGGRRCW